MILFILLMLISKPEPQPRNELIMCTQTVRRRPIVVNGGGVAGPGFESWANGQPIVGSGNNGMGGWIEGQPIIRN